MRTFSFEERIVWRFLERNSRYQGLDAYFILGSVKLEEVDEKSDILAKRFIKKGVKKVAEYLFTEIRFL
nr:hypothetical protein [Candidatus Freyarchaeota archaeon]